MPQEQKSLEDLQKDDHFMGLIPEAKVIVLENLDPNFRALSPEAKRLVVGRLKKPEDTESFKYGFKRTFPSLKDLKTTGRGLLGAPADEEERKRLESMGPYAAAYKSGETLMDIGRNIYGQQKEELRKSGVRVPFMGLEGDKSKVGGFTEGLERGGHLLAGVVPVFGPMAAESGKDIGTGHVKRGLGEATGTLTQVLAPRMAKGALKSVAPVLRAGARAAGIAPEFEVIEGVRIPRLASEVRPKSFGGRVVKGAKRLGLNEKGFTEFSEKQNQAVKEVIKNVAERTVKRSLPNILDNPADALNKAADAVEADSRAMYQALDSTVDQIPGGGQVLIEGVTPVIRKFLNQFPVTQMTLPGGDVLTEVRGIASRLTSEAESVTTPFQTAQDLRSALYKAARRATDANTRRLILQGVEEVDSSMETALNRSGSTELTKLWREANKGWAKKYALNEVADAVNRAIKGSPAEIADQPPKISAKPLANMLNDLSTKYGRGQSVMEKAFGATPEGHAHITAIRRAVSLLEEAQKVKSGGGFGKMRFATHGLMAAGGLMTGHLGYAGAAMALELTGEQISKAMTSLKGAKAVEKLLRADTASEALPLRREVIEEANMGRVSGPFRSSGTQRPPTTQTPLKSPPSATTGHPESDVEEIRRRGPGENPEDAVAKERQTEFLKTRRENLAGQKKEVPQKAADISKATEIKNAFSPENMRGMASEGFIDQAWKQAQAGKDMPFADRTGSIENKLAEARKAGRLKSREDVEKIVKEDLNKPRGRQLPRKPESDIAKAASENSPEQARHYQEVAAKNLFGKTYDELNESQRIKTLSEGAKLQDAARKAKQSYAEWKGKGVTVKGKPGTVIGTSFGSLTVKLSDGTILRVTPDEVKPGLTPLTETKAVKPKAALKPDDPTQLSAARAKLPRNWVMHEIRRFGKPYFVVNDSHGTPFSSSSELEAITEALKNGR